MKKQNKKDEKSLKKIKNKAIREKLINTFKKRWLIKGTTTVTLIAILIAIFIGINLLVKKWDPTAIDCTKSKDYSLTEESKNRVKEIEKDVNIYFVGYEENSQDYLLAKQYSKVNSKIKAEILDITKNLELAKKYDLTSDSQEVVVVSDTNSRKLSAYDLISYDETYNTVSIAEQKITSAILNVTTDKIPKIYYLTGYTSFGLGENGYLSMFTEYLKNEVLEYEDLNILNTQKVPNDCDTLIIITPEKDFDDIVANSIINYIKNGGNILWLNGVYTEENNFKNVNKVLEQYGVNKFEKGVIYETNNKNTILNYPTCFAPTIEDTEILKNVKSSAGAIFLNATKINIDENKLEQLHIERTDLITSTESTYFTKNLTSNFNQKEDEKGSFVLGTHLIKTISEAKEDKEAVKSELIIFGNDYFISDQIMQDTSGNQYVTLYLANNADVVLNSIAHLTNNDEDIIIRKSYSDSETSFTPTDYEKTIIIIVIFAVPVLIMIVGIIVWVIRKRRN